VPLRANADNLTSDESEEDDGDDGVSGGSVPGFGIGPAVVAIVLVGVSLWLRRRP
jgi:hypothetical protein